MLILFTKHDEYNIHEQVGVELSFLRKWSVTAFVKLLKWSITTYRRDQKLRKIKEGSLAI
jgi:hypothetical protein